MRIIITFILTLSFIQCIFGSCYSSFSVATPNHENIFLEKVSCGEGKPALVIEDIFLWPSNFPHRYHFECSVKNIGDANTPWYWSEVEVSVRVYWLLFRIIPLLPIFSHSHTHYLDTIRPGEIINLTFVSCNSLPKFGSYRFYLTVNPHRIIEESNYDNNKYKEDWGVFLGQWKEL